MGLLDIRSNPIILTDVYNLSHQGLKINTDFEVSHIYNRSKGMILYGFNELVEVYLTRQITKENVDEATIHAYSMGMPFPRDIFLRVLEECNGYLPLKVEALPEGTWCPAGTPFAQIRNTVKGFGELVTWLEGVLLHAHFASGCATEAFHMRNYLLDNSLPLTKFHSFGFRGHNSLEDAYWAGTAWNLFMVGTDDFHTVKHTPLAKMGSIPALAHKVTQQFDVEYDCYTHAIDYVSILPNKVVAHVIDTYDADRYIDEYLVPLAYYAFVRDVHIVVRPDSGDVLAQAIRIYRIVKEYGLTNVSVIIGEGMTFEKAKEYDRILKENGVPLDFVSYGIGAGFYKHLERDTHGWAMKTAYSNGSPRMKFSQVPLKRSVPGIVKIVRDSQGDLVIEGSDIANGGHGLYEVIYNYNESSREMTFKKAIWSDTRRRALRQDARQGQIKISPYIEELIETFREKYKG